MSDVVITGYSVVSPLGNTPDEMADRMFAGESGVSAVTHLVADPEFPCGGAGFIAGLPLPSLSENLYRQEQEVVLDHLLRDYVRRHGELSADTVIFGTNDAGYRMRDVERFHKGGLDPLSLLSEHGLNFVLDKLGLNLAPEKTLTCSNACATGLVALGYAYRRISLGLAERVLVFCNEPRIRAEDLMRFLSLGALSREKGDPAKISRPFTKSRSGFVKGEGAGLMTIETRASAEKRSARIYATLAGVGHSSDAYRLTDGREDARGIVTAMELALKSAGLAPDVIDAVSAHGTSTYKNDLMETVALKKVFGSRRTCVTALKSQIGHLNHACSLVETIGALLMLERQTLAPTINYDDPDPELEIDIVANAARPARLRTILKNSFGFGGTNASVVLRAEA